MNPLASPLLFVIPGFDPGLHVVPLLADGWVEPGHDVRWIAALFLGGQIA